MSEAVYLVEHLLEAEILDKKLKLLLRACSEQQTVAYKPLNKVRDVVAAVNSKLGVSVQRIAGIHLLKYFLTQCPDAVFVENCVTWMLLCLKGAENSSCASDVYDTLRMLFEMSYRFQELTKPITAQVIPKVLERLLKSCKYRAALECLQVVLRRYPGPCKKNAKGIRKALLNLVDEDDRELVEYAARCICYLPLVSTKQNEDDNTFTKVQITLCATANTVMDELFENVREFIRPKILLQLPPGYPLSTKETDDPFLVAHLQATRFINILTFIEGMIQGELPIVKDIRTDVLVALAYRGLAVNCNMVSKGHSVEHAALVSVLSDVHVSLLHLLQTFVSCVTGGLLKFGPLFCKIVAQTLKWTSAPHKYGRERPYRQLREAAYKFLETWILRTKAASCAELLDEELVSWILQDICQKRESVTLQVHGKGKNLSADQLVYQGRERLCESKANAGPCEAALRAACALVQTSGALLKPSVHLKLQETVVTLLLEIRTASGPADIPAPYSVPSCRLQLHRLLSVLTLQPNPHWPPPTQYALSFLPWGQHDASLEVVDFCTMALAAIRQMVHPSRSSPQFPMSTEEMRAAVGLPDRPQAQGMSMQDSRNHPINEEEIMEIDTGGRKSPTSEQLLKKCNHVCAANSMEDSHISQKQKPSKKNLQTPVHEILANNVDSSSSSPNSSKHKKKSKSSVIGVLSDGKELDPNSEKSCKKVHLAQFTVQTLENGQSKKRIRSCGQDWDVAEVIIKQGQVSKKKKKDGESLGAVSAPLGTKRRNESSIDSTNSKTRRVEKSNNHKEHTNYGNALITLDDIVEDTTSESSVEIVDNKATENRLERGEKVGKINSTEDVISVRASKEEKLKKKDKLKSNNTGSSNCQENAETDMVDIDIKEQAIEDGLRKTTEQTKNLRAVEINGHQNREEVNGLKKGSGAINSDAKDEAAIVLDNLHDNICTIPSKNEISAAKSPSTILSSTSPVKNTVLSTSPGENTAPSSMLLVKSIIPSATSPAKSPVPSTASPAKSPVTSTTSPSKSPVPSCTSPSKSPVPLSISPSKSPVPLYVSPSKSPVPLSISPSKSPVPSTTTPSKSAVPSTTTSDKIPIPSSASPVKALVPSTTSADKGPICSSQSADTNHVSKATSEKCPKSLPESPAKNALPSNKLTGTPCATKKTNGKEAHTPRKLVPIVEQVLSSDSEPEEVQKIPNTSSPVYRRITRSLAKRSSTPYRGSEQSIAVEEIPLSQENPAQEVVSEISKLEGENTSGIDPSVELADSDESADIVLQIESDKDSVEIEDVTSEATEDVGATNKDQNEIETSVTSNPNGDSSRDVKNLTASDREMEETNAGMEAVVESPDVALEAAVVSNGEESTTKKLLAEGGEISGSESAEEEILETFVDVVSPKST